MHANSRLFVIAFIHFQAILQGIKWRKISKGEAKELLVPSCRVLPVTCQMLPAE